MDKRHLKTLEGADLHRGEVERSPCFGGVGRRRRGDETAAGGVPDEIAVLQPFALLVGEREGGDACWKRIGDDGADANALACRGVVEEVPVLHDLGDADEAEAVAVGVGGDVVFYGEA